MTNRNNVPYTSGNERLDPCELESDGVRVTEVSRVTQYPAKDVIEVRIRYKIEKVPHA